MVPHELQDELDKRLKGVLKHMRFENPTPSEEEPDPIPLNFYTQHLPERRDGDISHFPFILTRVRYGEESSEDGHLKLQVFIVIAVYDESGNHQGHRDVLNIVQKVVNNLHHFRILNKTFERDFPLRWDYEDEDTFPVYFGTIETNWIMPETERKDVRDLI